MERERASDIRKTLSDDVVKMYEISGQRPIREYDVTRYIKDKEQDTAIAKKATAIDELKLVQEHVSLLSLEDGVAWVQRGLESLDPQVQMRAAECIEHVWPYEGEGEEDKEALKKLLAEIIENNLAHGDQRVQKMAIEMIDFVSDEDKEFLFEIALNIPDAAIQEFAAKALGDSSFRASKSLQKKIEENIISGLKQSDKSAQMAAIEMIESIGVNKKAALIRLGLEHANFAVVQRAATLIFSGLTAEETAPLQEIALERASKMLESVDIEAQKAAIQMILYLPDSAKVKLLKIALEKSDRTVRSLAAKVMVRIPRHLFDVEYDKLEKIIGNKQTAREKISPKLYQKDDVSEDAFSRVGFEKTDSQTTLVGGALMGKTIIRHIEPQAFLAWQRAYEDFSLWKNAGFDYVPIEPIQSYKLRENGLVDVYSGVLDVNLKEWKMKSSKFADELSDKANQIVNLLRQNNIEHGHADDSNFCLRFFREADGTVDLERCPRLYLIDFDRAKVLNS